MDQHIDVFVGIDVAGLSLVHPSPSCALCPPAHGNPGSPNDGVQSCTASGGNSLNTTCRAARSIDQMR